jgi:ATP diphosphatase
MSVSNTGPRSVLEPEQALLRLLDVMRRLREPERGCPWDLAQTFETLVPYTLEEAYEVADAVARADLRALRDELGDLLFQVVFHSRLAEEQGAFSFADVAAGIADKLTRRHPHVFADATYASAAEQTSAWEQFKAAERDAHGARGTLDGVARALPALVRAHKLGKRAAGVNFDWPNTSGVRDKVREELAELDEAVNGREGEARMSEELGDLLFVIANWARHLGLDAEAALRGANAKFERRFAFIEAAAGQQGLALSGLSAQQWETLWQAAKDTEKASESTTSAR